MHEIIALISAFDCCRADWAMHLLSGAANLSHYLTDTTPIKNKQPKRTSEAHGVLGCKWNSNLNRCSSVLT